MCRNGLRAQKYGEAFNYSALQKVSVPIHFYLFICIHMDTKNDHITLSCTCMHACTRGSSNSPITSQVPLPHLIRLEGGGGTFP